MAPMFLMKRSVSHGPHNSAIFIDSSGLRVLILSSERLRERGSELHVACVAGAVRRVFDTAALNERFAIYESREEAVAAVGSR